jgi:hypothetical protein
MKFEIEGKASQKESKEKITVWKLSRFRGLLILAGVRFPLNDDHLDLSGVKESLNVEPTSNGGSRCRNGE